MNGDNSMHRGKAQKIEDNHIVVSNSCGNWAIISTVKFNDLERFSGKNVKVTIEEER